MQFDRGFPPSIPFEKFDRDRNPKLYVRMTGKKSLTSKYRPLSESDFAGHYHQHLFHVDGKGYFVTWFDQELEHILDRTWHSSPSAAYALHQRMIRRIMETLVAYLPQVREHGCAPLPPWSLVLDQAMIPYDVRYLPEGRLNRAYAVLTFWPWRSKGEEGGCAKCALRLENQETGQRDCGGQFFDVRNSI